MAIFLCRNNPQMFMICKTFDQFKQVGTGLRAGYKQHHWLTTTQQQAARSATCCWNRDIQVAPAKSIKPLNFPVLCVSCEESPSFRPLRSWCPSCLKVCHICLAKFGPQFRSVLPMERVYQISHGLHNKLILAIDSCEPCLNPLPWLNSLGKDCKEHICGSNVHEWRHINMGRNSLLKTEAGVTDVCVIMTATQCSLHNKART